jgi:hypothetical protein
MNFITFNAETAETNTLRNLRVLCVKASCLVPIRCEREQEVIW